MEHCLVRVAGVHIVVVAGESMEHSLVGVAGESILL